MPATPGAISIKVVSDFACPWCHLGHARLNTAVDLWREQQEGGDVHIEHVPFMIDPATDPQGEEYMAYNVRRWGGDGWVGSMKRAAAAEGVRYANWKVWPNTLHAHRLMRLAQRCGKTDHITRLIFDTIYERGGNASDLDTLAAVGEEAGLDVKVTREFLVSGVEKAEVLREDAHAKGALGVSGVPCFFVQGGARERPIVLRGAVGADKILAAMSDAAGRTR